MTDWPDAVHRLAVGLCRREGKEPYQLVRTALPAQGELWRMRWQQFEKDADDLLRSVFASDENSIAGLDKGTEEAGLRGDEPLACTQPKTKKNQRFQRASKLDFRPETPSA